MPGNYPWHLRRTLRQARTRLRDEALLNNPNDPRAATIRGIVESIPEGAEPRERDEAMAAARRLLSKPRIPTR